MASHQPAADIQSSERQAGDVLGSWEKGWAHTDQYRGAGSGTDSTFLKKCNSYPHHKIPVARSNFWPKKYPMELRVHFPYILAMPYKEPEMQKLWRELNPEKGRQYRRTFYERHPDLKPKPRALSKITPEQKAAAKVIREANPIWQARKAARQRAREADPAWIAARKERRRLQSQIYRFDNAAKVRAADRRRYERKRFAQELLAAAIVDPQAAKQSAAPASKVK